MKPSGQVLPAPNRPLDALSVNHPKSDIPTFLPPSHTKYKSSAESPHFPTGASSASSRTSPKTYNTPAATRAPSYGQQACRPVDRAVITVPWFAQGQLDALREAAKTAGIRVVQLLGDAGAVAFCVAAKRQRLGFQRLALRQCSDLGPIEDASVWHCREFFVYVCLPPCTAPMHPSAPPLNPPPRPWSPLESVGRPSDFLVLGRPHGSPLDNDDLCPYPVRSARA